MERRSFFGWAVAGLAGLFVSPVKTLASRAMPSWEMFEALNDAATYGHNCREMMLSGCPQVVKAAGDWVMLYKPVVETMPDGWTVLRASTPAEQQLWAAL